MVSSIFTEPVSEEEPCGPDMQWDNDFVKISQGFEMAKMKPDDAATIDSELATNDDQPTFEEIIEEAEKLLKKTKDIRLMVIYAEASWHNSGLADFASAMKALVIAAETWSDHKTGIHPRADEDDGDLGMRVAPIGKLINQISLLSNTVGWGEKKPEITERKAIAAELKSVFDFWEERLEPAFGDGLPSSIQSWKTVQKLFGDDAVEGQVGGTEQGAGAGASIAGGDAWDTIERAAEIMAHQDRHSPALPVLRMLSQWRSLGIIEIANDMRVSGVTLEQLLESIKKQTTGVGGASTTKPVGPAPVPAASHPGLSRS